jgi:hypothetical protein
LDDSLAPSRRVTKAFFTTGGLSNCSAK